MRKNDILSSMRADNFAKGHKGFKKVEHKRENRIPIRLSNSELEQLKQLSESLGVSMADTLRCCVDVVAKSLKA